MILRSPFQGRPIFSLAFIVVALFGSPANALNPAFTCFPHGFTVTWGQWNQNPRQTINLYRDTCSIPILSNPHNAITTAINRWDDVQGPGQTPMTLPAINDNCTQTIQNGRNQITLVPPNQLPSNMIGLTTCHWGTCIFSFTHFDECDIKLANNLSYTAINEMFPSGINNDMGLETALHELGHFRSLGHTEGLTIMRAAQPGPVAGGNTVPPFPDDAWGSTSYNFSASNRTNVFASAQKVNGSNQIVTNDPFQTIIRCRGQTIPVTFTVGNNGMVDAVNVGFKIFLATTATASSGFDIFNSLAVSPKFSYFTATQNPTIPASVPNGTYFIRWKIDSNNNMSEFSEADNTVTSAQTVTVSC